MVSKDCREFVEMVREKLENTIDENNILECTIEIARDLYCKTGNESCYMIAEELEEYIC